MNDIEKQFIEGAARAMFVKAWASREENTCHYPKYKGGLVSGPCGRERTDRVHIEAWGHIFRPLSFAGQELVDVVPPTPDYVRVEVRLEAARLLGKVEQANGMDIAAIMAAAARADCMDAGHDATDPANVCQPGGKCGNEIDECEFGHYLAMQAMGHGVSWFDDHAVFWLGDGKTIGSASHRLRVPHFEFTMFDLEEGK